METSEAKQTDIPPKAEAAWKPARVEIVGRRRHIGQARETDFMGGHMLEVLDELGESPRRFTYSELALFSIEWISEEQREQAIRASSEKRAEAKRQQRALDVWNGVAGALKAAGRDGLTLQALLEALSRIGIEATEEEIKAAIAQYDGIMGSDRRADLVVYFWARYRLNPPRETEAEDESDHPECTDPGCPDHA